MTALIACLLGAVVITMTLRLEIKISITGDRVIDYRCWLQLLHLWCGIGGKYFNSF